MKIVLYCDNSPESAAAKNFLISHSLPFKEVDASSSEGAQRLRRRTQQSYVPAFELKRAHSVFVVVGFNKKVLEQTLDI